MIHAHDVHKHFGSLEVLKGVSLDIGKGEVLAVIGPSGSGKSTFLRCLNHLETVHRGRIDIEGETLVSTDAHGVCHTFPNRIFGEFAARWAWCSSTLICFHT